MSTDADFISTLRSNPSISNAFLAWIAHCQSSLSPEEFRSVKNFARAFQFWFDKAHKRNDCEKTLILSCGAWFFQQIRYFADEVGLYDDPIRERLRPESRTSHIGPNARRFAIFLSELSILSADEKTECLSICIEMEENLKRIQRAIWVMYRYEFFYHPKIGGSTRPVKLAKKAESDCWYDVVAIKENFVIAKERSPDTKSQNSNELRKIQIPRVAATLLKCGDALSVGIQKVATADYWVVVSFGSFRSGSNGALASDANSSDISQLVDASLLNTPVPNDRFPEDTYTEEWFKSFELDLGSDEEVGIWGSDDDDDDSEECSDGSQEDSD